VYTNVTHFLTFPAVSDSNPVGWVSGSYFSFIYTAAQSPPVLAYVGTILAVKHLEIYNVMTAEQYWYVNDAIDYLRRPSQAQVPIIFAQVKSQYAAGSTSYTSAWRTLAITTARNKIIPGVYLHSTAIAVALSASKIDVAWLNKQNPNTVGQQIVAQFANDYKDWYKSQFDQLFMQNY
jgi:hypothetical protein